MKKKLIWGILMLMMSLLFSYSVALAYNTGDDYPNKNSCSGQHDTAYGDNHNDYNERLFYYRQCTDFAAWCLISRNKVTGFNNHYGGKGSWGHAKNWKTAAERLGIKCDKTPAVGAIACWTSGDYGHVAWVKQVKSSTVVIEEYNYGDHPYAWGQREIATSNPTCYIHIKDIEVRGSKMTKGYDRVLPDGNYMIAPAGNPSYFLDISGTAVPAANGTNVKIYQTNSGDIPDSDAWSIVYYANGFYKISQYGQDVELDVPGSDTLRGKNVQVWKNDPNSAGQNWAVSKNGNNGYRLEAQCSGYSLDIANGTIANNTNVQVWEDNTSNAQSWVFIPYKPSQPFENGRYILLYFPDQSYELDVSGDTGDVPDGTNVKIWSDTAPSRYNSFDLTKLDNGYYKLTHAASGKCLTVAGGSTTYRANVEISTDNGSNAQQWAIIYSGAGYTLVSKANGYAIDLPSGVTGNGNNLQTYPRLGTTNQQWRFVQAEHTVRFNANGGTNAPAAMTKYYKTNLTLPTATPVREGYQFLGWSASSGATTPSYMPGDTYTADNDITLYAVWKSLSYTVSFDMNGGTGSLDPIHVNSGACTIPQFTPQRTGYDFLGWNTNKNATTATYHAGDIYKGGEATLYAIWKVRTYVVSFDSAGAGTYDSITVNHGATINLPIPKKLGFLFGGWYSSNNELVTNSTAIVSNLSLTARWSEPTRMTLPESLTEIEDEAFEGTAPNVVIIPDSVSTIGSRSFADNQNLYSMVVYSRSMAVADNAFENCPNMTVYGYSNSSIDTYCTERSIPFVALDSGIYILNNDLPIGAVVTDEKWTYKLSTTETTTSPETSLAGWTKTGNYSWEKTGSGTYKYASFPSGFDTGSSLYSQYNKSKLSSSSTETTKREAGAESFLTYIYWHWTFVDSVNADHASGGHNVFIREARKLNENVSGSVYRDFIYFDAFESTASQGTVGPTGSSTTYDIGQEGGYYYWRNNNADASQWWWRLNAYQQTYTDYRKIFTYTRTVITQGESSSPIVEGNGYSNVQHMVRYKF